ncbi:FAD-dependent oxidoreductase [Nocardia panacis]|uniref:FAD-dependent oxidoreductase n=1 Tax=Nocardia panacis TaxID=2340916 RepID=A0A3A4KB19_9NOCA|nr:FAD-dependent oxidoreductase [Nocardia panacis]RJO70791.1 FAD-dependent oxidoreductase [Nocardia panacis]
MTAPPDRVVIVGGGLAGHTAAATLRSQGFHGAVTLLTQESAHPYDRPPLSKELLLDSKFQPMLGPDLADLDIRVHTETAAVAIRAGEIHTASATFPFDAAVLAPGLRARNLPGAPQAMVLRDIEDAIRLRAELRPDRSVLIAGAGLIGSEVATAAAALGCCVTVVSPEFGPAMPGIPNEVLAQIRGWYDECGIELVTGVRAMETSAAGVLFSDSSVRAADLVIAAIGGVPATSWLTDAVEVDRRGFIVADEYLRTTLPGVYAVGDAVSWRSKRYGGETHLEHWQHAAESGQAAARNILGDNEIYDPLPYFWSHQLGHSLHYVGRHDPDDHCAIEPDPRSGRAVTWTRDGRPTAVLAIDAAHLVRRARTAIDTKASVAR